MQEDDGDAALSRFVTEVWVLGHASIWRGERTGWFLGEQSGPWANWQRTEPCRKVVETSRHRARSRRALRCQR